jgi:hypothetical protein
LHRKKIMRNNTGNILFSASYRKIACIFFAFLIVNFSANFIGLTDSLFDTFIVTVEIPEDEENVDLTLQNTGMGTEENQEEEHSSKKKSSAEEAKEFYNSQRSQFYYSYNTYCSTYHKFNIISNPADTPTLPPWA